jgi:hypothetical protein
MKLAREDEAEGETMTKDCIEKVAEVQSESAAHFSLTFMRTPGPRCTWRPSFSA